MAEKTITLPTEHGDAKARCLGPIDEGGYEWHIGYPWGDERRFGTTREIRAHMKHRIAKHSEAPEPTESMQKEDTDAVAPHHQP